MRRVSGELPPWVRSRSVGEVFTWEEKPPKDAKKKERDMWKEPTRQWFSMDQGKVGSKVPDWERPEPTNEIKSRE